MVRQCHITVSDKCQPGHVQDRKKGRLEGMEGKLNGNYLRLIPELCLETKVIGKFKMAAGDVINIRG